MIMVYGEESIGAVLAARVLGHHSILVIEDISHPEIMTALDEKKLAVEDIVILASDAFLILPVTDNWVREEPILKVDDKQWWERNTKKGRKSKYR